MAPPSIGLSIGPVAVRRGAIVANQGGGASTAGEPVGLLLLLTKAS